MHLKDIRIVYKPYWRYALTDILLLCASFFVVLHWFPLTTQVPFHKYWAFALVFSGIWLLSNYMCHRYVRVKQDILGSALQRLWAAAILCFGMMCIYMYAIYGAKNFSIWVLLTIWLIMLAMVTLYIILVHAYRYATYAEPELERAPESGPHAVLQPAQRYDGERAEEIRRDILDTAGEQAYRYLDRHTELLSSNTLTLRTAELYNIQSAPHYRYDTIINFMPLNQIRGINRMFGLVNDKLPDDGLFVCCFEPQSTTKKKILAQYPPVINRIYYLRHYLHKRVYPKLIATSRLYFDITRGKNRVLSRAEVMGRLCYCGFEIVDEQKVGDLRYVIARRAFRPQTVQTRLYGMFVMLNRVGKDGRSFDVYKFRTMHPYSEYLQAYIYRKYSLQEGGKFNHDIRVTTLGRFMRRYWIDELPMILNLLRRDLKLVGVRPISKHYYSLYSKELQEKRTHHKPGLLPPFYADLPKTLDEIQASEMRYLTACEEKGTLRTDFVYFWKIVFTILFRHAHSN